MLVVVLHRKSILSRVSETAVQRLPVTLEACLHGLKLLLNRSQSWRACVRPTGALGTAHKRLSRIKRHTLEETYEVFDAIDRRDWPGLKDELGDLLLQVLFYAQMANDEGLFSIEDVAANLNSKLIRRHPHIFGDATAETAEDVKQTWAAVKKKEREGRERAPEGLLDGVSRHQPGLSEAVKLGVKTADAGFDWPDAAAVMTKLREETDELEAEIVRTPQDREALELELGDLLFTAANLARHLDLEPEFALRAANAKFRRRFDAMEAASGGVAGLQAMTAEELEEGWRRAKQATKPL